MYPPPPHVKAWPGKALPFQWRAALIRTAHAAAAPTQASDGSPGASEGSGGNSKYLLRSRVTINIPDARLPPSVLQPKVAQDLLFYMRYRW